MTMNDTISDMLTRIRNAQMAGHKTVTMPASKLKMHMMEVMVREGYLQNVAESTDETSGHPILVATLKYYQGRPVIEEIQRVSRPGLRQYSGSHSIPMVRNGLGITIVSTSQGVMTDQEARKRNIGGEVLAQIF